VTQAINGYQSALRWLGFVPGAGSAALAQSAVISVASGDFKGAALDTIGVIPLAAPFARVGEEITQGSRIIGESGRIPNFSQTTASPWFGIRGLFAGQTISDVAAQLRAGTLSSTSVPVQFVVIEGNALIVNTRSSLALRQAGIPLSSWNFIDMTGNAQVEREIEFRLVTTG